MKYEITIEDLVPRRRELTVEIPEDMGDTDDLSEYLDRHPELWQDTHLPPDHQTLAGVTPAAILEPLPDDQVIAVEWVIPIVEQHRALATIGEVRQVLEAASDHAPVPLHNLVELLRTVHSDVYGDKLDSWLASLRGPGRGHTMSATAEDPYITAVDPATDNERDEHRATVPATPGRQDSTAKYSFTEASHGYGSVELADLAEAGAWQPGTQVTAAVLEEYFGSTGKGRGLITDTTHDYSRITYTGTNDRSHR
ncbi:hypothetical protein [Catenulispora pinisilvae]|uniref:hypothetical protein n=1 Tax=Catenulispora pinisilvae TaxID=2705253 RepID=UPI00189270F6|nr:hypothetical protein [Catenulispora pinisilvae]